MRRMEVKDLSKLRIEADRRGSSPQAGRRGRRFIWAGVAVLAVVLLAALIKSGLLTPPLEVVTVKVTPVFPSKALTILNASGYVVAQRKAAVSSKATGRLEKLLVEEGRPVKAGEVLAELENQDLRATLDEARAAIKVAKAALKNAQAELDDATLNYNRQKSLRKSGSVSEQAFDTAEARYRKAVAMETSARFGVEKATAALKVAEVNLAYSYIRAPFDGVILTKNADEGEVVAPFGASLNAKAAVVTMADMDSLMVEADVSESSLEKVKQGGPVEIRLDAFPKDRFPAVVHMIVPTADRSKATVMTKIKFKNLDEKILPEMSAKAAFLSRPLTPEENKPFLGIPASAIRPIGNRSIVYKVNDSRVHAVPVRTGKVWGDYVEVLSGLKEGDLIIPLPDKSLEDGRRVKVKE